MVRTFGLTHVALAVADAERAFAFYRDVFGMVAVNRGDGFVQAQTPDDPVESSRDRCG